MLGSQLGTFLTLTIKVDYCFPIISSTDHIRVDNVRHTSGYFFYRKLYNGGNFSVEETGVPEENDRPVASH
jgi:hypothetical protein